MSDRPPPAPASPSVSNDSRKPSRVASEPINQVLSTSHPQTGDATSPALYKSRSHQHGLTVPPRQTRSRSPDTQSMISADEFSELRRIRSDSSPVRASSTNPKDVNAGWIGKTSANAKRSWVRNKGLAMVLVAQIFATLMNVCTRVLEHGGVDDRGMDPFQILFARMSITFVLCMLYMWWTNVEHFPFGAREVRGLLVARGLGGFFGVFGLYWSLQYLPLADATVLTFLAPTLACWACSKLLNEPFTRTEQIGGLISLAGVVLITRPTSFFTKDTSDADPASVVPTSGGNSTAFLAPRAGPTGTTGTPVVTPMKRLAAVGMAMVGVVGASVAYTTIRWIGKRAHPLISVNYFSFWCTCVSTFMLTAVPSVPFVLPSSSRQWLLLIFIGITGFIMQFLLTAGLRYEKSSRATNMVYSQMIFALAFDKIIWGTSPGIMSIIGSGLILGSSIVVALQKDKQQQKVSEVDGSANWSRQPQEEELGLMADDPLMQNNGTDEDVELVDRNLERGVSGEPTEGARQET